MRAVLLQAGLRFRLLFSGRAIRVVLLCCILVFLMLLGGMQRHADDGGVLSIGVVNAAQGDALAGALAAAIREIPVFTVQEGTLPELRTRLLNGEFACIFEINEGYTEAVRRLETEGLITVHTTQEKEMITVLSDIVAGEMLYTLSLYHGLAEYERLAAPEQGTKLTEEEYAAVAAKLAEDSRFDFTFDIQVVGDETQTARQTDVGMLYRQLIGGLLAILLSMVLLFAVMQQDGTGLAARSRLSRLTPLTRFVGDYAVLFLLVAALGGLFCTMLVLSSEERSLSRLGALFAAVLLFCAAMTLLLLLLSRLLHTLLRLQIAGTALVLLLGVLGLLSVGSGFLPEAVEAALFWIPNTWVVRAMR